jgi:Cu-Zn family superoxide dismutase
MMSIFILAMVAGIPLVFAEPTPEALRDTIRDYIVSEEKAKGAFEIRDERTDDLRRLEFVRVHERVGKTGNYYYSCTDMKDVKTGDLLDLDFDIQDEGGNLTVADVRIHKDNGDPRYTYDDKDNRVPVVMSHLKPTQEGSPISGKVTFTELPDGLKIEAEVSGAAPGKHGFHIHEKGDCSDLGNAAGGHFNPDSVSHGDVVKDGFTHAHAGDLGNIEIDANGNGKLEKLIPGVSLNAGPYGVSGRSVILHEKEDDFGQPTGNAGGRVACGTIPSESSIN